MAKFNLSLEYLKVTEAMAKCNLSVCLSVCYDQTQDYRLEAVCLDSNNLGVLQLTHGVLRRWSNI